MPIFQIKNLKLNPIKEKRIDLERNIQSLTEKNLDIIFGWEFVASEFRVGDFFIDTLAFDPESKAFVIIEYKKDKSFSVIDQGVAYLSQMLDNQDTFILEYNERSNKNLRRKDVDWSQSRVIFIADSFTNYQQNAIGFRDLPIELWEVKLYEDNLISYSQLKSLTTKGSIKTVTKDRTIQKISRELVFPLSRHLDHIKNPKIKELFEKIREEVQSLGRVEEISRINGIGYWRENVKFLRISFFQDHLTIRVRIQGYKLHDPKQLAKELNIKDPYWKKMYKEVRLNSLNQVSDAMYLIKQAYEKAMQRV
jgi:predicted transport protein